MKNSDAPARVNHTAGPGDRLQLLRPKRTVVNPAPNAGRHRAFGSVMILACSADCVSAVERKFIAPRERAMRGLYFDHILTSITLALMLAAPLGAFAQDSSEPRSTSVSLPTRLQRAPLSRPQAPKKNRTLQRPRAS